MKVIIHCGSSKNGSTALQSFLLANYQQFSSRGTQILLCSYDDPVSNFSTHDFSLEHLSIYSERILSLEQLQNATASFAIPYEIYKKLLLKRDVNGLRKLRLMVSEVIARALTDNTAAVIISAEAFETSLCLKDPLFKRMIVDLSKIHEVELIYFAPNPAKHAVSAWLQWGWIEKILYPDWLLLHLNKTNMSTLVSSGGSYFSNLYDTRAWVDYWRADHRFFFRFISGELDVVKHFFEKVHFIDVTASDFNIELTSTERNMGWPKSLITMYPLCFDFISGDYVRYEVLRQLLIDKESEHIVDTADYDKILKLTGAIFAETYNREPNEPLPSMGWIDTSIASLQNIFNHVDDIIFRRLVKHICDVFYFYHLRYTEK